MKHFYLLLFVFSIAALAGYSQKQANAVTDPVGLKETTFDFGKIPQGRPVTHNFEVVNKGKTALLIENVEASCGCTTPEFNQAPIAPGASSIIKVGFNAANEGKFQKQITIYYGEGKVKGLTISGEVYAMPTTSAPPNASLSTLKQ